MYYKEYGNTGIKVSAIGFGAMRYDMELVNKGEFEKCAEVALYAYDQGINYFDTAPFYCDDKSEEITGIALSQLPRDKYYVTSKTNLGTLKQDFSRDAFMKKLHTSLERLKVDYIDFYHMWCMLSPESYQKHMELLYSHFEEAKREGLIKNIVFSSHMEGSGVERVVQDQKFAGVLLGYNALNYKFRQSGIEAAYKNGMGVVVMNPQGGGLIPENPKVFEYLTKETDLTVAQAALRFVASHKEVSVTLAGCTTKSHVDDGVIAVKNLKEISAKEISGLYETKVSLNNLCTGCQYCDHCPVNIPVPKFMDAYNMKLLGQDPKDRLKGHWGLSPEMAAKCISCKKCEQLCTQHLPIIERLAEIGKQGI